MLGMGLIALIAGLVLFALVLTGAIALVATASYLLLQIGIIALLGYGAYKAYGALRERYGTSIPSLKGRRPRHAFQRTSVTERKGGGADESGEGRQDGDRRPHGGRDGAAPASDGSPKRPRGHAHDSEQDYTYEVPKDYGRRQARNRRGASEPAQDYEDVEHAAYVQEYIYLDFEAEDAPDTIRRVMAAYLDTPVVGSYASSVRTTLDALEFRRRSLLGEIDAKFSPRSLSWEKFHATAVTALDAALRNCALLGNRVQTFDVAEYERYLSFMNSGGFSSNPNPGKAALERWKLCCDTLGEMDEIRDATDGLMTELVKLSAEISRLDSSTTPDDTRDVSEEVARLVDETKLYR